jgi:hypothetical protein
MWNMILKLNSRRPILFLIKSLLWWVKLIKTITNPNRKGENNDVIKMSVGDYKAQKMLWFSPYILLAVTCNEKLF